MNGLDLVREVFPDASDDDAGYLLWNITAFPFTEDPALLREQLVRFRDHQPVESDAATS